MTKAEAEVCYQACLYGLQALAIIKQTGEYRETLTPAIEAHEAPETRALFHRLAEVLDKSHAIIPL
jgi:predicted secreted protein